MRMRHAIVSAAHRSKPPPATPMAKAANRELNSVL